MKESLVYNKAFKFSISIVNLYNYLCQNKSEYTLSRQILRSGTSIAANIKEGLQGQSRRDFLNKMNISLKEASETEYWIELLITTKYIDANASKILLTECKEINRILGSIVKTIKNSLKISDDW